MSDQIPGAEVLVNPLTQAPIANEEIQGISELAFSLVSLQKKLEAQESAMQITSASLARIRDVLLPDAMMAVGMESLTLSGGVKLKIVPFYSASIPSVDKDPERRAKCYSWLRDNNFGDIIKTEVTVPCGKGDEALAKKVMTTLEQMEIAFHVDEAVHWATLKSLVREQVENSGKVPPVELFSTFVGKQAKVTK